MIKRNESPMTADDCIPGTCVVIGGKYLGLGTPDNPIGPLFGVTAVVKAATPRPCGDAYPHGMVSLELPEDCQWPTRTIYVGPEDLAPVLAARP
jgi:hypothetical protein